VIAALGFLGLIAAGVVAWILIDRARSAAEGALGDLRDELEGSPADRLPALLEQAGLEGVAESLPDATPVDLPDAVARHLVPVGSPLVVLGVDGSIRVSDGEEPSARVAGSEDVVSFAFYVLSSERDSIFAVKVDREVSWYRVDEVLDALLRARARGVILLAESSPEAPPEDSFPGLPGGLLLVSSNDSGWSWPEPLKVRRATPPPESPELRRTARPETTAPAPPPPQPAPPTVAPAPIEEVAEEEAEAADPPPGAPAPGSGEPGGPVYVAGDITKPEPIDAPRPRYPRAARRAGVQGVVILQLVIEKDGTVRSAEVLRGLPMGVSEQAVEAVRRWRFRPATLDGQPIVVYWNLTLTFER
jgi:protein TonB